MERGFQLPDTQADRTSYIQSKTETGPMNASNDHLLRISEFLRSSYCLLPEPIFYLHFP